MLHSLDTFGIQNCPPAEAPPTYWYEGRCPQTRQLLRLPRTALAEAIARGLMKQLAAQPDLPTEGKMYGILLVATPAGEQAVLKAFSGLLQGQAVRTGWVPPIPGRAQISLLELQTLEQLEAINARILALKHLPERTQFERQSAHYAHRMAALNHTHRQRKQARDRLRQTHLAMLTGAALEQAFADLVRQSQQDGIAKRRLKGERDEILMPLKSAIAQADDQIMHLKQQRKTLSRQLQAQMHTAYSLTNFAGETTNLQTLRPEGLPTGTGDCAAPKLLHYAAAHHLTPLALAEFWWGPATDDRQPEQFYGACRERCQPIMGFLLSGLSPTEDAPFPQTAPIDRLYEDEHLLVVNKPAGLLSVPGRRSYLQDSILSRLRCQLPNVPYLAAPHRLDKGTSGLLMLAKSAEVHRQLNHQFAQRQVKKIYEAILSRAVASTSGIIDLPLWRDPRDRPKTSVHFHHGKPSLTEFQILEPGATPRIRLIPHTGRTHQLRVHAAHPQGLNAPILGDPLYGEKDPSTRLCLHAQYLKFTHPVSWENIELTCPVPF